MSNAGPPLKGRDVTVNDELRGGYRAGAGRGLPFDGSGVGVVLGAAELVAGDFWDRSVRCEVSVGDESGEGENEALDGLDAGDFCGRESTLNPFFSDLSLTGIGRRLAPSSFASLSAAATVTGGWLPGMVGEG